MVLLSSALVSVAEAIDFVADAAIDEDLLTLCINASTLHLEKLCNRKFVAQSIVEQISYPTPHSFYAPDNFNPRLGYYEGVPGVVYLDFFPVVSIISIADQAGNQVDTSLITVFPDKGIIRTVTAWPLPVDSQGNPSYYTVTYSGGLFPSTSGVASDLKMACLLSIDRMAHKRDMSIKSKSVGDLSISYSYGVSTLAGIPEEALTYLESYRRPRV